MLRKSIGRGHRGGAGILANNNSFRMDAGSDVGSNLGNPSIVVPKYDQENFAIQYYNKNSKLIEDFFVIGIDQEDVM